MADTHPLDQHHALGILLLILMFATIPLFIWAMNQPNQLITQAYYPRHCETPKIPRNRICSSGWILKKNDSGCRVFVCEPKTLNPEYR